MILSTLTTVMYGDIFSVKCTNVKRDNLSLSLSRVLIFHIISRVLCLVCLCLVSYSDPAVNP